MSPPGTIHASAVVIDTRGVLIRGISGSGKSSLALGLIERDPDATFLVADDRIVLAAAGGAIEASAPPAIAGKLEVRGLGIVALPYVSPAAVALVVDLLPARDCPRLPEPAERQTVVMGRALPRLALPVGAVDGVARVRFALRHFPSAEAG